MPEPRRFVWKKPSQEQLKTEAKKIASSSSGMYATLVLPQFSLWKPKKGTNRIRLLPPTWDDAIHYALKIFIHRNCGPDNESFLCVERHLNERCAVCEERISLREEGDQEAANQIRAQEGRLAWMIDRDDEETGPQLWQFGVKMERSIGAICEDDDGSYICIFDPEEGFDVEFVKDGEGLKTQYIGHRIARRPTPISQNKRLQDKWLDLIANSEVPTTLNFYSYDHVRRVFQGGTPLRDPDLDRDDAPARRSLRDTLDDEIPEYQQHPNEREDVQEISDGRVSRNVGRGEDARASAALPWNDDSDDIQPAARDRDASEPTTPQGRLEPRLEPTERLNGRRGRVASDDETRALSPTETGRRALADLERNRGRRA